MPLAIKPENIVDRDHELDIFKELLQFANEARLLTIKDREGTGKTELLKKLWHHCRRKTIPPQPVSRVLLDEIKSDDPFLFVTSIREELPELNFPTFDELNAALADKNFAPFAGKGQSRLDARGATVSGENNRFADTYQESETINNYYAAREWDSDRELFARKACTRAFFSDLKQVAAEKSVVILFDSYDDRCNSKLYDVIWNELITPLFDPVNRPHRLALVVTGRDLPDIPDLLGPRYGQLVFSRESLGWTEEHLRKFLVVHGVPDLTEIEFSIVWRGVENGATISKALTAAKALREMRA